MYTVALLQILSNRIPRKALVYLIENNDSVIPLSKLKDNGYEIKHTFVQNGDTYLILEY